MADITAPLQDNAQEEFGQQHKFSMAQKGFFFFFNGKVEGQVLETNFDF